MKTKTLILAALAAVFAAGAVLPTHADEKAEKREKRVTRMIKRIDQNQDSRISPDEMNAAIQATVSTVDTDGDGAISSQELAGQKAAFKARRAQAKTEKSAQVFAVRFPKSVTKHFDKIDADKNGLLSEAEIDTVAERLFKRRDKNKDGYISKADFNI